MVSFRILRKIVRDMGYDPNHVNSDENLSGVSGVSDGAYLRRMGIPPSKIGHEVPGLDDVCDEYLRFVSSALGLSGKRPNMDIDELFVKRALDGYYRKNREKD